jgi:ribosomal protein S18 acetylase RimI-like enzyme
MNCKITEGEAEIAYHLAQLIPEFSDPLPRAKFDNRLNQTDSMILVVYLDGQPVGFKIGYHRNGEYYSWLGAILPAFRMIGLAKILAFEMEKRALTMGYQTIWMKTRNRYKGMLLFAIRNGFQIVDIEKADRLDQYRIILEKKL